LNNEAGLRVSEHRWRCAFGAVLLVRLLYPFFNSPLTHLFSDPLRHWENGARFWNPDLIGAGDPYLYQLWIHLLRAWSSDSPPVVQLACGLLCAAMPYGWYRALRELLPRQSAYMGAIVIGLAPSLLAIYAYFMNETLLLSLLGFAFWASFRAARKRTLGAYVGASALWTATVFTRSVVLPMALFCLGLLWLQSKPRPTKAVISILIFCLAAVPAGMHGLGRLNFFAPFGNLYLAEAYSYSGKRDYAIEVTGQGSWVFGSPAFYNPSLYPFSNWLTDRTGTARIRIDLAHGRDDWIAETNRVARERTFPWVTQYKEHIIYLLLGQQWPANDPASSVAWLATWLRWLWPPLMAFVAWGVIRHRYLGWQWLLPLSALGTLVLLAIEPMAIMEGRYRVPFDPILLASAMVLWNRTHAPTGDEMRA
jgi:Dolichyl-phosphate-mannose-protein mannosyltransferase